MSITIGTVNKDGTGTTLSIKVPEGADHTAATTASSHSGVRWGTHKRSDLSFESAGAFGTLSGPVGGAIFKYYSYLCGDVIPLQVAGWNGGAETTYTILSKLDDNRLSISTSNADASSITAFQGIEPLGDLVYKWDCPGASGYTNTDPDPLGLRSSVIDPETWYGPHTICPHYEVADTYTITLNVYDYANDETSSKTITVTASANTSATEFYISNSGDDTIGTGTSLLPWRTWAKGLSMTTGLFAANGGANGRILNVERGFDDTMTASFGVTANRTGPFLIRPYGTGANPIVRTATFNGIDTVNGSAFSISGLRIVDIDFTKSGGSNTGILNGVHHDDSLVLRCSFTTAGADAYAIRGTGATSCSRCTFADCTWTNDGTASYAVFWEGATALANMTGRNLIACNVRGSTGSMIRMFAYRNVMAYNDFNKTADSGGGGPAVRFDGSTDVVTGESVLWRNKFQNTADNSVGELFVLVTQASANRIDKVTLDANYWDGGAQGVTNIIKSDLTSYDNTFRNNTVRARTSCTRFMSIETTTFRRWRIYNNSWFGDASTLAGFRFGTSADGGMDHLHFFNNVVSMIGTGLTTSDYGLSNVGNSGFPDVETTKIDYNHFHITDTSPPLFKIRVWSTQDGGTNVSYDHLTGAVTETNIANGYTHVSGNRALVTKGVNQNAANTIRLIQSKTSDNQVNIIADGWGTSDLTALTVALQGKSDTNFSQLSTYETSYPNLDHNQGGVGASAVDPLFTAPSSGDLTLQVTSPCRGAGLALPWVAFDYAGDERLTGDGDTADMGAFAYTQAAVVIPPSVALTLATFAPTVTATDAGLVTPTTVALTLTTFAPTVTAGSAPVVTPDLVALVLTTFAPVVMSATVPGTPTTTATAGWAAGVVAGMRGRGRGRGRRGR